MGLTRAQLDKHREWFGLEKSLQAAVSGKGGKVSHLALSEDWNQLPYSDDQTLKWNLGVGKMRMAAANPLRPEEDHPAVPIFFVKKRQRGGGLCHYVGHYKCCRFDDSANAKVMFKGEPRQALIEFKLVEFKEDWNAKFSDIVQHLYDDEYEATEAGQGIKA